MLQDWLQLNLVPQRSSLCSLQHLAFWTVYIVYKPAMFRTFNIETVCCLYIVYLPATFKALDAFSKCTVLLVSLVSLVLLVAIVLLGKCHQVQLLYYISLLSGLNDRSRNPNTNTRDHLGRRLTRLQHAYIRVQKMLDRVEAG